MECPLENITVNYETFGNGKPMIILPGWSVSARMTAHRMEPRFRKREGWKRIYIDPPGHGKTSGKNWITNLDKMLEVILGCIDKLTEGQNFGLIGISLGAYLARGVLLYRANLVDGLAMVVPGIFTEDDKRSLPSYQVLVEEPLTDAELTKDEEEFLSMSVVRTRKWLEELRSFPQIPEDENGDAKFLETIRNDPQKYAFSFDVDTLPEPFQNPALIIAGRQDHVVGYKDAWNILDNFPRASYIVLDRMGHFTEESGTLISALMNDWLERVEESIKLN